MDNNIIIVGPKIFPPFDSAYSSIGFNFLKSILKIKNYLKTQVTLITTYDLDIYKKFYNQKLTELLNYEFLTITKEYISAFFNKHKWSNENVILLDYMLLKFLKEFSDSHQHIVLTSLSSLMLTPLYLLLKKKMAEKIKISRYIFHFMSIKEYIYEMPLYDLILISSNKLLNTQSILKKIFTIPPPIDIEFFKPLSFKYLSKIIEKEFEQYRELIEMKERDKTLLLYTGPLHPDRFPMSTIIKFLKLLKDKGMDPFLIIITTIRHKGIDDKYITLWKNISKRLNGLVKTYVRALSEYEKLILYNLADVVLYPIIKPWALAVPPLTILEAYACEKPVIMTSQVPGYDEIVPEEFQYLIAHKLIADQFLYSLEKALNLSKKERHRLRLFTVKRHSIDIVAMKLLRAYISLLK
jgi:glycosyltransferase involved in cell wall biosynthesis